MADKDWSILSDVVSTLEGSGLLRLVRLGAGPRPEDVPVSQLPACFVAYEGTDEFPSAGGDDELFCALRFRLALIVKGQEEDARIESAVKLANDVKDTLMVDRFRSSQAAYGPAQKPTEFGPSNVSAAFAHPFTVLEIDGSCGFYTSEVAR
ncbi:MAG TPA: hypothetical protein VMX57_01330 [Planctomycetota bacterium]|nr:hypothetical protein [Planctomycetota bacterium]